MGNGQGWGQFNSGIGIAAQFQFQFRNWNWNWWNWKWNWNWKPWNWNWNWNWKPELNFLQLLLQQLLVNQPFPNFSFNRGHNLSCDWLFMQQVFLGHPLPPCGVVTKDTWAWYLVPLEWTEARRIKDGDKKILLTAMTQTKLLSLLNKWMISGLGVKLSQHKFQSHFTYCYLQICYDNPLR